MAYTGRPSIAWFTGVPIIGKMTTIINFSSMTEDLYALIAAVYRKYQNIFFCAILIH